MTTFFTSLWNGIIANKDAIITFITSAEFAAMTAMLVGLFKNNKSTKNVISNNTALSADLTKLNQTLTTTATALSNIRTDITTLRTDVSKINTASSTLNEQNSLILKKLDAVLEVQRIVYSTLKNENSRVAVENILTNAIHSDTLEKVELVKQLDKLKATITEHASTMRQEIVDVVDKAETIVHVAEKVTTPILRN